MSILEFISQVVSSIAWPIAVLILGFLLRKPLGSLIPAITRIQYGDVKIDVGKELREVREAANKAREEINSLPEEEQEELTKLLEDTTTISAVSPSAAIAFAWLRLQSEINAVAHKLGMQRSSSSPPTDHKSRQFFLANDKLPEPDIKLIDAMYSLRNEAMHNATSQQITEDDAKNFAQNTIALMRKLRAIAVPQSNL